MASRGVVRSSLSHQTAPIHPSMVLTAIRVRLHLEQLKQLDQSDGATQSLRGEMPSGSAGEVTCDIMVEGPAGSIHGFNVFHTTMVEDIVQSKCDSGDRQQGRKGSHDAGTSTLELDGVMWWE